MNAAAANPSDSNFNHLAETHRKDLYKYAYRLSGDSHTAEDLVQDSLLRAWRSLDKLKQPAAIKDWLKTIVRRENARRFERAPPQQSERPVQEISAIRKTYDTSTEAFVLRRAIGASEASETTPESNAEIAQSSGRKSPVLSRRRTIGSKLRNVPGNAPTAATAPARSE